MLALDLPPDKTAQSDRIRSDWYLAPVLSFSPAGEPFWQDARTGPVGPGSVQGADAGRTDAARARPMPSAVVAEPWRVAVADTARPARGQPGTHVARRSRARLETDGHTSIYRYQRFISGKSEPEEPAIFLRICESDWQDMVTNIETFCAFLQRIIFIHGDDVLKIECLCRFGSDSKSAHDLTSVYSVEKVAVVDEEARAATSFCTEPHKHHVETEDLHVFDPLAARTLHGELELWAVGGFVHGHAAR